MLRSSYIVFVLYLFFVISGCSDNISPQFKFPNPPKIEDGCKWSNAKLSVFKNDVSFVKFRYRNLGCLETEYDSVFVDSNGNDIIKLSGDVGMGGFSVFEHGNIEQKVFVQKMVDKHWEHDGVCEAVKIEENVWKIDDGKAHNANINFMPCGVYGRTFSGEKFFIFMGDVVFNFKMSAPWDDIDYSSVEYFTQSKTY